MKLSIKILCLLLLVSSFCFGQMQNYTYKREIKGVSDQWHRLVLPDALFGKTNENLSDLRIFGLTETNDTIEAPYLLTTTAEKISDKTVEFKTLNTAHNAKGWYYTFDMADEKSVNQIALDFSRQNFDWRISLEGSHHQREWFTILENYRILSIKNSLTDFTFTKLNFPEASYRFLRLRIESKSKPKFRRAHIKMRERSGGKYRNYPVENIQISENRQNRQTEIELSLQQPVRVSEIKIGVADSFDYYRPIRIKTLTDSVKTEQGWKYSYTTLTTGMLNSIEEKRFDFRSITAQKLKITIDNYDNEPLTIDTIAVRGSIHELVARFTQPAAWFLTYGNKSAAKPRYDIRRFTDNIPKTSTALELGREQVIEKAEVPLREPLFKNKAWLWAVMVVIIALLGWFSLGMIRKR